MAQRLTVGLAAMALVLVGVATTGSFTAMGQDGRGSAPVPPSKAERGNVTGEWRYWGADAWSTRYSPLDQINASNFGKLTVKWQWAAGAFGADEYYRTTPLYANGRLFTVASTRRVAAALDPETGETLWMWRLDEGIRWQKAPRQFAGRGLAYWTDGKTERVIVTIRSSGRTASST
jgi:quinoprotein glucose dehydrogenase